MEKAPTEPSNPPEQPPDDRQEPDQPNPEGIVALQLNENETLLYDENVETAWIQSDVTSSLQD